MERDHFNEYRWLDAATRDIRFGPDRKAVRAELYAHLEDKRADLRRIFPDISPEEAERRAVESMGDPEEIGRELAKLHKPWLGYLWVVSRVLAVAACLWLVSFGVLRGDDAYLGDNPYSELWDFDGLPRTAVMGDDDDRRYLPGDDPDQLLALETGLTEHIEGQNISLRRAALWKEVDGLELYLYLRIDTWRFWERGYLRQDWMRVADDRGNSYTLGVASGEYPGDGSTMNTLALGGYGPFHRGYELYIRNLDPEAQWIRVDYGPEETLFSFVLELEEGV